MPKINKIFNDHQSCKFTAECARESSAQQEAQLSLRMPIVLFL